MAVSIVTGKARGQPNIRNAVSWIYETLTLRVPEKSQKFFIISRVSEIFIILFLCANPFNRMLYKRKKGIITAEIQDKGIIGFTEESKEFLVDEK